LGTQSKDEKNASPKAQTVFFLPHDWWSSHKFLWYIFGVKHTNLCWRIPGIVVKKAIDNFFSSHPKLCSLHLYITLWNESSLVSFLGRLIYCHSSAQRNENKLKYMSLKKFSSLYSIKFIKQAKQIHVLPEHL